MSVDEYLSGPYRDLVKAGRNPERLAQEEGRKLQEMPGGVRVEQVEQVEGESD